MWYGGVLAINPLTANHDYSVKRSDVTGYRFKFQLGENSVI